MRTKCLISAILVTGVVLARLPQKHTNGASAFGTLNSPHLANFLPGPLPQGYNVPWGGRHSNTTNPYYLPNVPNTGITRSFYWTITNTSLAPDGVSVPMLIVNGQFPGPLIEANWGDEIEVHVTNNLVTEPTAIHWHGFLQTGTPFYDGTATISQCPIAPGKTFTYRFRAELYGSSWWHSHYSAQYTSGIVGPIVIHGPTTAPYDIDLGPVMLSDWYHDYYVNTMEQFFRVNPSLTQRPPVSNNMLINGKSSYDCGLTTLPCTPDAGVAQFHFQTGKRHLLRLINTAAEAIAYFSIDGYEFTVIANDFVPVVPYNTNLITLGVGQRTDIIVYGSGQPTDSVWMRVTEGPSGLEPAGDPDAGCSLNDGNAYNTSAAIYYQNADTNINPSTTYTIDRSRILAPQGCNNDPLDTTVPSYPMAVTEPDLTLNYILTGEYNATGQFVWYMNNITFYGDLNDPELLEAKLGNDVFLPERNVVNLGTHTSIRIVITSIGFPASHPMHVHGHNFQVLSAGPGSWDGQTIVNPSNPQRRDTQLMGPNSYIVLQITAQNPGLWPLHCHIAWHIGEGLSINLLEQPAQLQQLPFPASIAQTCRDWAAWTGNHVVDQIDSGL